MSAISINICHLCSLLLQKVIEEILINRYSFVSQKAYYGMFVANVACGLPLKFEWYYYIAIYAAIIIFYNLVSVILTGKLSRMTPAEVLKNRE